MSPWYLESEWCRKELNWFLKTKGGRFDRSRQVFVIEAIRTDKQTWPKPLRDSDGHAMLHYSFLAGKGDFPLAFDNHNQPPAAFTPILEKLVTATKSELEDLRADTSAAAKPITVPSPTDALPAKPYPGLRPYQAEEHRIFFGRDDIIQDVTARLDRDGMVVVHGSSGCGKSSLVRAGVLPVLQAKCERDGVAWRQATISPGSAPLWNLANGLAQLFNEPTAVEPIRRALNETDNPLQQAIDLAGPLDDTSRYYLLIDQFEELFRFENEADRSEAEQFVRVLMAYQDEAHPPISALLTMRSDFLGLCAQFDRFANLVNDRLFLVPRLERSELVDAIASPAELYGTKISIDLKERLLSESRSEPDALPLVQHALKRLWDQLVPKDKSTAEVTGQLGVAEAGGEWRSQPVPSMEFGASEYPGLKTLLSDHADEVVDRLAHDHPEDRRTIEYLFRALAETDEAGRTTRNPQPFSRLLAFTNASEEQLSRIIDAFANEGCGFLTRSKDADPVIDIGHEALLRCWDRLRRHGDGESGWLDREESDAEQWRVLVATAEAGGSISPKRRLEREKELVDRLPGPGWAEKHGGGWQKVEELIRRSSDELKAEAKRLEDEERRKERRFWAATLAAFLAMIVAGIAGWGFWQASVAEEKAQFTQSLFLADLANQQTERGNAVNGILLALDGLPKNIDQPERPMVEEAAQALYSAAFAQRELSVLNGHSGRVLSVGFSPDGARLVSGGDDGKLRLWDASNGNLLETLEGHNDMVWSVGISPDGARLVSGGDDGTLRLWDASTGSLQATLEGHSWRVSSVGFSPDGARLVSGGYDGTVRIWTVGRSLADFVEIVKARLPRELTPEQEVEFFLRPKSSLESAPASAGSN